MGGIKDELNKTEMLDTAAHEIAIEAGAIKECENHPGTYITCYDEEAEKRAYAIGTNKIKNGKVDFERKELMDAIKSAMDETGDECYSCEKWKNE